MNIVTDIKAWQAIRQSLSSQRIGFVATMGHLHEGHLSLCQRSQAENDITVVSIFVNPTQFNQASDFNTYPKTLEADQVLLKQQKVDYVFCPDVAAMYPDAYTLQMIETEISQSLEGFSRPGHFTGMLTIVLKLLNLVQATRAYFGEKDYQQYLLIEKMAKSLFLSTDMIACPTIRAADGLALSSRNTRLSPDQRKLAAEFPAYLNSDLSDEAVAASLVSLGFKVDYIATAFGRRLGAVWVGEVRLIDNVKSLK